jgi:hypothetical protein
MTLEHSFSGFSILSFKSITAVEPNSLFDTWTVVSGGSLCWDVFLPLDVAENISMGIYPRTGLGLVDRKRMSEQATAA